mmetsp:Transcript_43992/g.64644  ORF Transcript_43992/g.64644 Transcript_43992/m.64644 type:complete len:107 (-) Transcript_43992:44-364(-)
MIKQEESITTATTPAKQDNLDHRLRAWNLKVFFFRSDPRLRVSGDSSRCPTGGSLCFLVRLCITTRSVLPIVLKEFELSKEETVVVVTATTCVIFERAILRGQAEF